MSNPSFLEKLLDGASVEWKPMSAVAEVRSGWGFPRAYQGQQEGSCPFYKVSDMNIVGNETTMVAANNCIDDTTVAKLGVTPAPAGTIIFPKIGAAIATNKKRLLSVPSAYDNNVMGLIPNEKVVSRFLFYWKQIVNLSTLASDSGAVPSIRKSDLEKLLVPIPCPDNPEKSLAIQAEIVRILDSFTELKARIKQYNHYRDQLLSFEEGDVEWKTLGELGELVRGNGLPKRDLTETGVPAIHYGQIYTYYGLSTTSTISFVSPETAVALKKVNTGDVVITNTSKNFEDVGTPLVYLGNEQAVTGGHATIFKPNQMVLGKFFAYFTQTPTFEKAKRQHSKGAKVIDVSAKDMSKILIPIPCPDNPEKSLAEQARIVAILDKFDVLTASLSEGLPREIKLRQQQYEYYRNLLLSFPRPEEA